MVFKFTRKDNGKPAKAVALNVVTWNVDEDGAGTMLVMKSGVVRPVVESYDEMSKRIAHALKGHCCDEIGAKK